jgi:hypothetical protein
MPGDTLPESNPSWSPDGSSIGREDGKSICLLDDSGGSNIVRFDVAGGKLEPIVSLGDVEQAARGWIRLDETDTPLFVLDKSVSDVYRLDLKVR